MEAAKRKTLKVWWRMHHGWYGVNSWESWLEAGGRAARMIAARERAMGEMTSGEQEDLGSNDLGRQLGASEGGWGEG